MQLYEKGYGKDAAGIAMEAIKYGMYSTYKFKAISYSYEHKDIKSRGVGQASLLLIDLGDSSFPPFFGTAIQCEITWHLP